MLVYWLFATLAAASPETPQCPAEIDVSRAELRSTPPGWQSFEDTLNPPRHVLRRVDLYSGHPSKGALLKPEQHTNGMQWNYLEGRTSTWLVCRYEHTATGVMRKLPAKVSRCLLKNHKLRCTY